MPINKRQSKSEPGHRLRYRGARSVFFPLGWTIWDEITNAKRADGKFRIRGPRSRRMRNLPHYRIFALSVCQRRFHLRKIYSIARYCAILLPTRPKNTISIISALSQATVTVRLLLLYEKPKQNEIIAASRETSDVRRTSIVWGTYAVVFILFGQCASTLTIFLQLLNSFSRILVSEG